jgi:hypothetical protein
MDASKQRKLILDIMATEVDEWDCAAVMDAITRYVEQNPSAAEAGLDSPALTSHLEKCGHCAEMHATLAELVRLDASGALPAMDALWQDLRQILDEGGGESHRSRSTALRQAAPSPKLATENRRSLIDRLGFGSGTAGRPALLLRAAGLAALLLSSLGWARAEGQVQRLTADRDQLQSALDQSQASLSSFDARLLAAESAAAEAKASASKAIELAAHYETTIDLISQLDRMAFAKRDDGAWARIVFDPDKNQAVVYVGNLPGLEEGQWVECWLKRRQDGRMVSAGSSRELHPGIDHWMVNADSPLGEHSDFMLTIEPEHAPLFELPLGTQDL